MALMLDNQNSLSKKGRAFGMLIIGNGPAFLQTVIMLEEKDILPVTNNDADFLTLEKLGLKPLKADFQCASFSFISENSYNFILITSSSYTRQIFKALEPYLRNDHVLLVVKTPKMGKGISHPHIFYIDTVEQFDNKLWHRSRALDRLVKMKEYFKSRLAENQKTLKLLVVFFGPPDPDAIASSVAFVRLFPSLVSVTYASTAKVKRFENRALLSYMKIRVVDLSLVSVADYQAVACFDSQPSFFAKSGYTLSFDFCMDHHPEASDNPVIPFMDIRKHHGSCSTILAQYYYYSKKALPRVLATALLIGIKTDTANFTRSAYEPDVSMMVYLNKKADHDLLKRLEFSMVPKRAIKYFKRAFARLRLEPYFAFCHLGKVGYVDIGSILADQFLKIQKVHFSAVSCIYGEKVIVFLRSSRRLFHAGEMASKLFVPTGVGGGHSEMGRAECLVSSLPYMTSQIESVLCEAFREWISKQLKPQESLPESKNV